MHFLRNKLFKYLLISCLTLCFVTLTMVVVFSDRNTSKALPEAAGENGNAITKAQKQLHEKHSAPNHKLSRSGRMSSDRIDSTVSRLKDQQAELSEKLKQIESKIIDIQSQRLQIENSQDPIDPETLRQDQESEEEKIITQLQSQMDLFDSTLYGESPDPQWSAEAEHTLEDNITEYIDTAADQLYVDCGSSLCRIDFVVPQDRNIQDLQQKFSDLIPWNSELFFRIDPSEAGDITIYASRENYSLPRMPSQ